MRFRVFIETLRQSRRESNPRGPIAKASRRHLVIRTQAIMGYELPTFGLGHSPTIMAQL